MPPKRAASRAGNPEPSPQPQPNPNPNPAEPRHGAAIRSEMPPLPSRLMSSYGSQTVAPLINIRRGKRRELGDAIGEALLDPLDEFSDIGSPRPSVEPFTQDPLPELVPVPGAPRDEPPAMDSDDEFQPPESEQDFSAPPSPVRPTRRGRRAGAQSARHEPPVPTMAPPPKPRRARESTSSTSQSDELAQGQTGRRVTRSSRARSANPAPEPVEPPRATRRSRRGASIAPTQDQDPRRLMPPPDLPSNATDRSFSMESEIFRNATIESPQPDLGSSPPVPPSSLTRSGGSIRERLARARGQLRYTTTSLAQGQRQARDFLFGPRRGGETAPAAAPNGKVPPPVKAASSSLRATGPAARPRQQGPREPEKTPSPQNTPSRLGLDGLWVAMKPARPLWVYLRALLIIALFLGFIWNVPRVYTPDYSRWDPGQTWDSVTATLEQINPFASTYSNATVDAAHREYKTLVKQSFREIERLQRSSTMYEGSVQKMEELMPRIIHMDVKNGRPEIPDEFWHALRDLIRADEDFVSIQGSRTGPRFTSGKHWDAVLTHVNDDLGSGHRLAAAWEGWLKKNRVRVLSALQLDEKAPAPTLDAHMKDALEKLVKERLQGPELKETVVTRDEFVRHIRGEFATHRQEIRSEMRELEGKLEGRMKEALKAAESGPAPVSAREVKVMVRDAVAEELGRAQLGALARGGIHRSWAADLRHRVNFFAVGTGAVVNPLRSSPTYAPPRTTFGSRAWLSSGKRAPPRPLNSVLLPWDDSGDAWCGASTVDRQGRPNGVALSVQLGRSITPEHLVVEHILPEATLEPAARPKEIELWAAVEGVQLQQRLLDFAATHFPPRADAPVAEAKCDGTECFYLVGRFEYESDPLQGGVFVHRLSPELGLLGVRTDHVRVVARSNFGDEGKTCFYRLRLYGEVAEGV